MRPATKRLRGHILAIPPTIYDRGQPPEVAAHSWCGWPGPAADTPAAARPPDRAASGSSGSTRAARRSPSPASSDTPAKPPRIRGSTASTIDPAGLRWYLGGTSELTAARTVFREHPSTRAIREIDICSARRNRRISAQSSTLNTHFLPGSVRARLSARVVRSGRTQSWRGTERNARCQRKIVAEATQLSIFPGEGVTLGTEVDTEAPVWARLAVVVGLSVRVSTSPSSLPCPT